MESSNAVAKSNTSENVLAEDVGDLNLPPNSAAAEQKPSPRIGKDYQAAIEDRRPFNASQHSSVDIIYDRARADEARERGEDIDEFLSMSEELGQKVLMMRALHNNGYCVEGAIEEYFRLLQENEKALTELDDDAKAKFEELWDGETKDIPALARQIGCSREAAFVYYYNWKRTSPAYARTKKDRHLAAALLRELTPEELGRLDEAWREGQGHEEDIIARTGQDVCIRKSLRTLLPGTWLNDEVIHYYLSVVLAANDAELCRCDPSRRRSHFFKSFFMTKLRNHYDEANPGVYSYENVKRWSRKVPGQDVFALDKIFFPINQINMHWVCAVAYMQAKRIQFYDGGGSSGMHYLQDILHYLRDEHMDKKKSPMPDAEEWELVDCTPDTPRQYNGFDCGVFTCMFCDFLFRDLPLVFAEEHMARFRQRIAFSILNNSPGRQHRLRQNKE